MRSSTVVVAVVIGLACLVLALAPIGTEAASVLTQRQRQWRHPHHRTLASLPSHEFVDANIVSHDSMAIRFAEAQSEAEEENEEESIVDVDTDTEARDAAKEVLTKWKARTVHHPYIGTVFHGILACSAAARQLYVRSGARTKHIDKLAKLEAIKTKLEDSKRPVRGTQKQALEMEQAKLAEAFTYEIDSLSNLYKTFAFLPDVQSDGDTPADYDADGAAATILARAKAVLGWTDAKTEMTADAIPYLKRAPHVFRDEFGRPKRVTFTKNGASKALIRRWDGSKKSHPDCTDKNINLSCDTDITEEDEDKKDEDLQADKSEAKRRMGRSSWYNNLARPFVHAIGYAGDQAGHIIAGSELGGTDFCTNFVPLSPNCNVPGSKWRDAEIKLTKLISAKCKWDVTIQFHYADVNRALRPTHGSYEFVARSVLSSDPCGIAGQTERFDWVNTPSDRALDAAAISRWATTTATATTDVPVNVKPVVSLSVTRTDRPEVKVSVQSLSLTAHDTGSDSDSDSDSDEEKKASTPHSSPSKLLGPVSMSPSKSPTKSPTKLASTTTTGSSASVDWGSELDAKYLSSRYKRAWVIDLTKAIETKLGKGSVNFPFLVTPTNTWKLNVKPDFVKLLTNMHVNSGGKFTVADIPPSVHRKA